MPSVTYLPPPPTEEQPPQPTRSRQRRRRRSAQPRLTVLGTVVRVLAVLALVVAFLVFWHGVAFTQDGMGHAGGEGRFAFEPPEGEDAPAPTPAPAGVPGATIPLRPVPLPVPAGVPGTGIPLRPIPLPITPDDPVPDRDHEPTGRGRAAAPDPDALPRPGESLSDWLTRPGAVKKPRASNPAPAEPADPGGAPAGPAQPPVLDPDPTLRPDPAPTARSPRPRPLPQPAPARPAPTSQDPGSAVVPTSGTPVPLGSPGAKLRGIGELDDRDLPWTSTLDLVLAYEMEFASLPPTADPTTLRREFYHQLIDLSVSVGHTDNPRDNLDAVRRHVFERMALTAVERPEYPMELLRPSTILAGRRGSPTGIALIALVLADRLNPYLELEPVRAGDLIGLRYRSGHHRYILVPAHPDQLYSDREFAALAFGKPLVPGDPVEVLTRRQLWGLMFGHTGAALMAGGDRERARARSFVSRGLGLFEKQSIGHLARARLFMEDQDLTGAREELDRAVALSPDSAGARLERVKILEALGANDAVEEDLLWLSHRGKRPDAGLRLADHLLRRNRYQEALEEVQRVQTSGDLPPGLRERAAQLRRRVLAAPWVAVLRDTKRPARDRFAAVEELARYPIPMVTGALGQTLSDPNLRLARFAWKKLQELTGWDLPFDAETWLDALAREARRQQIVGAPGAPRGPPRTGD